MKVFLGDECLLYLSDDKCRNRFEAEGWKLVVIGDLDAPKRGTTDRDIYDWMVQNEVCFIITSNSRDFKELENQKKQKRCILSLKKPFSPQELVLAIKAASEELAMAEWGGCLIPLGKFRK